MVWCFAPGGNDMAAAAAAVVGAAAVGGGYRAWRARSRRRPPLDGGGGGARGRYEAVPPAAAPAASGFRRTLRALGALALLALVCGWYAADAGVGGRPSAGAYPRLEIAAGSLPAWDSAGIGADGAASASSYRTGLAVRCPAMHYCP